VFVDRVLRSGIVHTRPLVVARETTFHAGDPLDESALLDTQRRLYGLALFNEVTTAVQNPDGDVPIKNVLLQLSEARRWNVTYGFGLEAETGTPQEGVNQSGVCDSATAPAECDLLAGGQDGSEPARLAGCEPDQSARDGQLADSAFVVRVAGGGGHSDVSETSLPCQSAVFGERVGRLLECAGHHDVPGVTLQADYRITQKVKRTDTVIYDFSFAG